MYRSDHGEPDREQYQSQPGEPRFPEPFDHAAEDSRPHENSHPAQVHHEIADVGLRDGESVHENQWQGGSGPVERPDRDRVDPDQSLRRLFRPRDDAPYRAGARLVDDAVLARRRDLLSRFAQINRGEDADQNAEDRGRDPGGMSSKMYERGTDRGADDCAEAGCRGEPAEALGA